MTEDRPGDWPACQVRTYCSHCGSYSECGARSEWRYPAMGGGFMYLCAEHGAKHAPYAEPRPAALALCGQPFGFAHDDVEFLRLVAGQCDALRLGPHQAGVLRDIAARIAALLPPENV